MRLVIQIAEVPYAIVMLVCELIPRAFTAWVCKVPRFESQMEVKSPTENVVTCSIITQT